MQYGLFSFVNEQPLLIGCSLSTSLIVPLDYVLLLLKNYVGRKHAFQADEFAFNLSSQEHCYADLLKRHYARDGLLQPTREGAVNRFWSACKAYQQPSPVRVITSTYFISPMLTGYVARQGRIESRD